MCGHVLEEGSGTVPGPDGPVAYTLTDRRLHLQGELGQTIECEVCVSAIDARGHELYKCINVSQSGVLEACIPCLPRTPHDIIFRPIGVALQGYRPVFAVLQEPDLVVG